MSGANRVKRGRLAGTGSNIKINCQFPPVKVELYNEDAPASAHKTDSMDGAFAHLRVTGGTGSHADSVCTLETDGFTIGDQADINTSGETIHWMAWQAEND